jgi:hypothetical protein
MLSDLQAILWHIDKLEWHSHCDGFIHAHTVKIDVDRQAGHRIDLHLAQNGIVDRWAIPLYQKLQDSIFSSF